MVLRTILLGVCVSAGVAVAQDDSIFEKIQIHGGLSQGFLFSSSNNWLTTDSSNGSFRWNELMINFSDPLTEHLRAGIQLHSYMLGQIGQQKVTVDWALGDYKFNDRFGVRAGKVKTPLGLFNDIQDVDVLFPWALLPQSVYPADMRSFHLAHTGFVAYGDIPLPHKAGSIDWQGFAGERSQDSDEGFTLGLEESGIAVGDASGPTEGADVRWKTPLSGFLLGASYQKTTLNAPSALTDGVATPAVFRYTTYDYYTEFERGKLKLDVEWNIEPSYERIGVPQFTYQPSRIYYFMGAWHFTDKLTAGTYYSYDWSPDGNRDHHDPDNYAKDTALNTRYDFNGHFYTKLEGHYVSGDADSFYTVFNPNGVAKVSKLFLAKVGFSF
jgi:hypothetical protein